MDDNPRRWKDVNEILNEMADLPEFCGLGRPDVNTPGGFGNRPLKIAAVRGDVHAIEVLVAAGAEIDALNEDGWTALHHAASQGHLPAIQRLVELGATLDVREKDGLTPLEVASLLKHQDIADFLRAKSG
jgi:ankyrin repeat protein